MEPASSELQNGLQTLHLVTEKDLQRCRGRVRRLAQGLPAFDSVWLDALVEQKLLTPFQAQFFEEKRWSELEVNSELLLQDQTHFDRVMPVFLAIHKHEKTRFTVCRIHSRTVDSQAAKRLSDLIQRNQNHGGNASLAMDFHCDPERSTVDVISRAVTGTSLADLLVRRGRFPEQVVCAIASIICRKLSGLPQQSLHGDLRLSNFVIDSRGRVEVLNTGILNALMPVLNIHEELPADAYDGLAPERFDPPQPASVASDLYALGCLMWHLLAGRPPHLLADPLAKIAAHRQQEIKDIREVVPDCSEDLANLLTSLTSRRMLNRPKSFEHLGEMLQNDKDRPEERIRQFIETFESHAPRNRSGETKRERHTLSKVAVVILLTALTVGIFWNRDQFGLPELSNVAASSSETPEETVEISPLDFQPLRTASLESSSSSNTHNGDLHPVEVGPTALELPAPDHEGVIDLVERGPYQLRSFMADHKIVIRSNGISPSKIIINESNVSLTAPLIEFQNVDIEFQNVNNESLNSLKLNAQELRLNGSHFGLLRRNNALTSSLPLPLVVWNAIDSDSPMAGRLLVTDCVNATPHTLLCAESPISTALFQNVIQVTSAALIEIRRGAKPNMLVPIVFNSCTHCSPFPAVILRPHANFETSGKLSVQGSESIFAATADAPLFGIVGRLQNGRLPSHLEFSAQGLIVQQDAMLVGANQGLNRWQAANTETFKIDGLISGRFHFEKTAATDDSSSLASIPKLMIEELTVRTSQNSPGFHYDLYEQTRSSR